MDWTDNIHILYKTIKGFILHILATKLPSANISHQRKLHVYHLKVQFKWNVLENKNLKYLYEKFHILEIYIRNLYSKFILEIQNLIRGVKIKNI